MDSLDCQDGGRNRKCSRHWSWLKGRKPGSSVYGVRASASLCLWRQQLGKEGNHLPGVSCRRSANQPLACFLKRRRAPLAEIREYRSLARTMLGVEEKSLHGMRGSAGRQPYHHTHRSRVAINIGRLIPLGLFGFSSGMRLRGGEVDIHG